MPARLAQQEDENGMMEGRVPTTPIVRPHEQGVGGPPPSNLSQFVHFSCRSQPHGRDFLGRHDNSLPVEGKAAGQGWVSSREGIPKKWILPVHPPRRMSTPPLEGIFKGVNLRDPMSK
jgi:hypothetical protein